MNDLQSTLRELRKFILSPNNIIGWFAASVVCIIVAPFGSGESMTLPVLTLYWFTSNALTLLTGETVMIFAASNMIQRRLGVMPSLIGGSVLSGIIITLIVFLVNTIFLERHPELFSLAKVTFPIAVTIAFALGYVFERNTRHRNDAQNQQDEPSPFFKRLPVHLGNRLLHLSTQDHYVEAVTEKGSQLILMRFADALEELKNTDGIQVHRSHWIAKSAISGSIRKNGRLIIQTIDNREFPVSRTHLQAVKDYFRLD